MKLPLRQLAKKLKREIAIYQALLADSRTPRVAKWLLGLAVAYALSPVDLIPDFIPVLGYLDDVLVLPMLVGLALKLIPADLVEEHRTRVESQA